jgi:hypothetical protein
MKYIHKLKEKLVLPPKIKKVLLANLKTQIYPKKKARIL